MKVTLHILVIFFSLNSFSQQIGDGYAPLSISNFSVPLKSGIYNGLSPNTIGITPDISNPWQHLLVMRHNVTSNNYQLQIASSFNINDRLFFRKIIAGDLSEVNTKWMELATRGANYFIGDQNISGNVGIGKITPNAKLDIFGNAVEATNIILSANYPDKFRWRLKTIDRGYAIDLDFTVSNSADEQEVALKLSRSNSGRPEFQLYNNAIVANNGNVGIGTENPTSKLTVAGNINSREVKVTVDAGADFVFENDYNLPSLDAVDKYIKENKHLPEIASADEMKKDGINLSEMNIKLLQKIEELTLYTIEQNKQITELKNENKNFKLVFERLSKLEKKLK